MEGKYEAAEAVWIVVKSWAQRISVDIMNGGIFMEGDQLLLEHLNIPFKLPKKRKSIMVVWRKPKQGWVKLNADGSCRGDPGSCGDGGVIRDIYGNVKWAYSSQCGYGNNNKAELRAITCGVRICKQKGFLNVEMECDSKVVGNIGRSCKLS